MAHEHEISDTLRQTIEAWRYDYNHLRPHGSLGALTPNEFAMLRGQELQPRPRRAKTTTVSTYEWRDVGVQAKSIREREFERKS
jgi:hypothetical protein